MLLDFGKVGRVLLCFCVDRAEILEEERHAGVTGHAGGRPSGWKTINLVRNSGVIVIISNLIMMLRVAGSLGHVVLLLY